MNNGWIFTFLLFSIWFPEEISLEINNFYLLSYLCPYCLCKYLVNQNQIPLHRKLSWKFLINYRTHTIKRNHKFFFSGGLVCESLPVPLKKKVVLELARFLFREIKKQDHLLNGITLITLKHSWMYCCPEISLSLYSCPIAILTSNWMHVLNLTY